MSKRKHERLEEEEVTASPDEAADNGAAAGSSASDTPDALTEQEITPADGAESPDAAGEDGEALEVLLEQAEARADEYLESLRRERAAFQNYKRRVEAERADQRQAATADVLLKLLPVLDDFHRAMDAVPEDERNQWYEGVQLIQRKFERVLADQGVTEIEAQGEPFDPKYHEAVGVDPDSDAEPETVTVVLQRGYMHGERVLRPAMVRVAG